MQWQKIALVGIGLLGGSLGLAIRAQRLSSHLAGYARRRETLEQCRQLGLLDTGSDSLETVITGADLVIFCTPISQMTPLARASLPYVKKGAVITDVGSVKAGVVREMEPLFASIGAQFVGSHPMAGAEKTGVGAARADLFERAACVVTPTPASDPVAVGKVSRFWEALGGRVLSLGPEEHDQLVSRSSHLPHVVAAELANYVLGPGHPREQAQLCANGFRDTTRIASGSPEMWRDIALANRENLARALGMFVDDLQRFRQALEHNDEAAVRVFFENAQARRNAWCSANSSPE